MENTSSSDIESAVALTEQLGRDLLAAMTGKLPENPLLQKKIGDYAAPSFGSIYFGPLGWFAEGSPHFGMVTDDPLLSRRVGRRPSPEVPFSPITTRKKTGREKLQTVLLPAGTLPSGRNVQPKQSRILLFFRIPISQRTMRRLMDEKRMHHVQMLKEHFLAEARAILAGL